MWAAGTRHQRLRLGGSHKRKRLLETANKVKRLKRDYPVTGICASLPCVVEERELLEFGVAWYPDWPPLPTWGDLRAHGRLGATCSAEGDAAAQCGADLVCRKGVCRHCISDKECPSLYRCARAVGSESRCMLIGKRAWEQVFSSWTEGLCTVVIFLAAALASAAGTGGGGMFVPVLETFSALKPAQAVPLSQVMILGGSLVNICVFLTQRHPTRHSEPVIDYNCVVLLAPMLFLGVTLGVLLNQMSPQWLLLMLLCLSLGFAFWRTASKGIRQFRTEAGVPLPMGNSIQQDPLTPRSVNCMEAFLELTNKDAWQVIGIILIWLLMLASSGHGMAVCSTGFTVFLFGLAMILVGCTAAAGRLIAKACPRQDDVKDTMPVWASGVDIWSSLRFPLIGFGAGLLGGLLGLGGGIIMSPVLLEVGMHSEAVQATTVVFVLLSSSLATIQFAMLQQHIWDYALWYGVVAVAASLLGQHFCEIFVRKSGRYSFITLAIAGVLGASLAGLLVVGAYHVMEDLAFGRQMWFSATRLCSQGGLGIVVVDVLPTQAWPADLPQWSEVG